MTRLPGTAQQTTPPSPNFSPAQCLSLAAAEAALTLLARAERISILAGAGVEHDSAAADLSAAAERWSIPVATTLRAKGVFYLTSAAYGGAITT